MSDRIVIISSDTHAGLRPERYRDYVDPKYRETFDIALPIQNEAIKESAKKFLVDETNAEWRKGHEDQLEGAWDSSMRIEVLEGDGCSGEVIFPDGVTEMNTPPFGAGLSLPTEGIDPELQWAGARAHNRWLAEFCAEAPERRAGMAIVLIWDIDEAVEEVRWARSNGLRGILLPTLWGKLPAYQDRRYDPLWSVCEELDMPVTIHSGAAPMGDYGDGEGMVGTYISEVCWWTARPLTFMIWGGVFERHPNLKVVITEGTSIWVPEMLELWDFRYDETHFAAKLGDYRSHLSMKPSEYFRRNVFIGASCMSRRESEMRDAIGVGNMLWGSDYPHPEGTWPFTREKMCETFQGLPEDDVRDMLGRNAARVYGFDLAQLGKVAEKVGPTLAEITGE